MEDNSRQDIRRLLKTFGVKADESIITYLARHPEVTTLRLRVTLEDITDYGERQPTEPLHLVVESEINRS